MQRYLVNDWVGAGEARYAGPLLCRPVRDGNDMITRFVLFSKVESHGCIRRVRRHSNPDSRSLQVEYPAAHVPGRCSHIVSIKFVFVDVKPHGTTTITVTVGIVPM